MLLICQPIKANILDWFNTGRQTQRESKDEIKADNLRIVMHESADNENQKQDVFKLAQEHFVKSGQQLHQACQGILARHNDEMVRDIIQKLFSVSTQIYRENVRNPARSTNEIADTNTALRQNLQQLAQIVTSPGNKTLGDLQNSLNTISAANANQVLLINKYMSAAENLINLSSCAHETIMLIPALGINSLDLFVKASQDIMRISNANAEGFKSVLLNLRTSTQQINNNVDDIRNILRQTLRFSDHFAINQFPLINIPTPSRERIYAQINTINNSITSINNSLSISSSQVKNASQQFSNIIADFFAKSNESLRYRDNNRNAGQQISNYARNQISGLYLRTKEDISRMQKAMAQAATVQNGNTPPQVTPISPQEGAQRRAQANAANRLPLFLLGGQNLEQNAPGKSTTQRQTETRITSARRTPELIAPDNTEPKSAAADISMRDFKPLNQSSDLKPQITHQENTPNRENETLLYSESSPANAMDLLQAEMNILQNELGNDFFFGDLTRQEPNKNSNSQRNTSFGQRSFNFDNHVEETDENQQTSPLNISRRSTPSNIDPELLHLKNQPINFYSNEKLPAIN